MYFPVSEIEVQPWVPPLAEFAIWLVTSTGRVASMCVGACLQKYVPQTVIIAALVVEALVPAIRYLVPSLDR